MLVSATFFLIEDSIINSYKPLKILDISNLFAATFLEVAISKYAQVVLDTSFTGSNPAKYFE